MAARTDNRFWWTSVVILPLMALVLCGCERAKSTTELLELAKSKDSADRARAIKALSERGEETDVVVPALTEALKDENAFVRRDAAQGLGRIGPAASTAVPALRVAVRDKNQHVRQAASEALRQIAPDLPPEPGKR
jgi:HEAT repeat protein